MNEASTTLPKWIFIVSAMFALLEIAVSIALCVAPETVADNVDLNAKGVSYLLYMWAARQFALGFIFGFAALKRSRQMLMLAYIFFLVMMIGDLAIGIFQNEMGMITGSLVMCVISSVMIFVINRRW